MAFTPSISSFSPTRPFHFHSFSSRNIAPQPSYGLLRCTSQQTPATEQDLLKFVTNPDQKILPCVRTYENDLAQLSLVGPVRFDQALTAAASDGGKAAAEHIDAGVSAMVIETVFPGASSSHATVSTRLFLPADKVQQKAYKLRRSISEDILSGITSRNILAMTFRQVVIEQLWNFKLVLFSPGTQRDMKDLENPREVAAASFTVSSSDKDVISVIAEVVCDSALESTETRFLDSYWGRSSSFFRWFQKRKKIVSNDSSVALFKLYEDDILENAKNLLEHFHSMKGSFKPMKTRSKDHWWTPSVYSKLEKIGGPEFGSWTYEYVPAYRLEIDTNRLKGLKLEGWSKSAENQAEIFLTHSQMVGLADTLDMYFEDIYSLRDKQLPCGVVGNYTNLSSKKSGLSLLKILSATIASGVLLITISALGQFHLPHQSKGRKFFRESHNSSSSEIKYALNQNTAELEPFCALAVNKIKQAIGWPGDITTEKGIGAWIGEVPTYLKVVCEANPFEDNSTNSVDLEKVDESIRSSVQDIASYQVVLSTEGKVVGFKPTSRVGVNNWATNPLAKELYGGTKLAPGFLEPGLKAGLPDKVVMVELLMSVNSESPFALARPIGSIVSKTAISNLS